jgi:hypothetical protein
VSDPAQQEVQPPATESRTIPYAPDSGVAEAFHITAALGGGKPHRFEIDTGSVGVLVPRDVLGPAYQDFDPGKDQTVSYVSSGNSYQGQWVTLSVVMGVPESWDGSGDYPTATIAVFAVDHMDDDLSKKYTGGMFGVGFDIGDQADAGAGCNPFLNAVYRSAPLTRGYILTRDRIVLGPTAADAAGFAAVSLRRNAKGDDWQQPVGHIDMAAASHPDWPRLSADLTVLMDTGVPEMLLWLTTVQRPANWPDVVPPGAAVTVSLPADGGNTSTLTYSFITGAADQPMAPSAVNLRKGKGGLNTGRHVLARYDYLYDADGGRIGFRAQP